MADSFLAYHERAFRTLLDQVRADNPFYREKLTQLDLNQPDLTELVAAVPFTTKSEIIADQLNDPPYGRNLTHSLNRYVRFHQTSATTGQPLRWLDTAASWREILYQWETIYRLWGVSAGDRVMFCFSFGPFLGFWSAFEAAANIGCLCLPGGGLDTRTRASLIEAHRVNVLCCTPTYAIRLGQVARESKCDVAGVSHIFVAGEPGGSVPGVRAQLAELWPQSAVIDHHGMTEVGPVSFAWPQDPGFLRILDHAYLAEVIDPESNQPVPVGERGELVLTTLKRAAMPLIRYRTGDLVEKAEADPVPGVSSNLALRGGILGRIDDMVVIRGVNIYPAAVDDIIRSFGDIDEYRVELSNQDAMTEMSIAVEVSSRQADPKAHIEGLMHAFRSAFALRIPIRQAESGSLPRFELKAKRWTRI